MPKLKLILEGVDFVDAVWRKSSFSGDVGCVEVADVGHYVLVRDSKHPSWTPLKFTRAEWAAFIAGAQDGEFDLDR